MHFWTVAEAIQPKPASTGEGAVTMSQAAAQSAIKKNDGEDSLSPFTSDNEDAKPSKWLKTYLIQFLYF